MTSEKLHLPHPYVVLIGLGIVWSCAAFSLGDALVEQWSRTRVLSEHKQTTAKIRGSPRLEVVEVEWRDDQGRERKGVAFTGKNFSIQAVDLSLVQIAYSDSNFNPVIVSQVSVREHQNTHNINSSLAGLGIISVTATIFLNFFRQWVSRRSRTSDLNSKK